MALSIREAAREGGVSKSTVLRAIQRGRLSAARDDDGNYNIEPSELFRVYAPRTEVRTGSSGQGAPADAAADAPVLRTCIEGLDAQIAMVRELVETANQRAERAEAIADSVQRHADAAQKQIEAALKHVEAVAVACRPAAEVARLARLAGGVTQKAARRSTKRDQQIRDLLKQLEELGADSQQPDFLRDIRVRRTVDGVSLGLLDDLAAILAGLLPSPKGRRRAFTGRLAQRIVDAAPAIGRPVGEVVTEVVQHFRLDAKAARLLRNTVDRLLDERDAERPRPRG